MPQANFQPTWALIRKPPGYPEYPQTGKPEMIWSTNKHSLYHRLSPYTDYDKSLIGGLLGDTQPYLYTYPDENKKGLNALMKYDSRLFPIGSAPRDVIRVAKFLGSGNGILFLGKQFLLQTGNPYNERRIYNPTSPIVAAGMGLALGSIRPERSFDTSGGLVGIATTLLGSAGSAIFGAPKTNPVPGTTLANNSNALPTATATTGTKGLIRAGTAERAKSHLDAAWGVTKNKDSFLKGLVKSLFQNFIPQTQPDMQYRSDEGAYGLMLNGGTQKFQYDGDTTPGLGFGQRWWAGGKIMRKKGEKVAKPYRLFTTYPNQKGAGGVEQKDFSSGLQGSVPDVGAVGYSPKQGSKDGQRYGDSVGVPAMENGAEYTNSDVMYQYKYYTEQPFPTKNPDINKDDVNKINFTLSKTITELRKASGGLYTVMDVDTPLIRSGASTYDYDRLSKTNARTRGKPSALNYSLGVLKAYRDSGITLTDASIAVSSEKSYKLPTNGALDAINTLKVLDGDKKVNGAKGWTTPTWEPYKNDLVALYFYDVVNDKYVPFRCAVKGLSEAANASWEEMPFIGRADRVYSYGGFSRSMNFNLKIVVNSIAEIIPTWQRINYITTAIKPANYTFSKYGNVTDRFMVPPMFMLTLGDMYRDQPILIQAVTVTVPDDASWETMNIDNSDGDWNYLAKMIAAPGILYGQLPREVELGFTITLLEKERAVVGGANFGHAPRNEDWSDWNTDTVPTGGEPNKMHQELVVDVMYPAAK